MKQYYTLCLIILLSFSLTQSHSQEPQSQSQNSQAQLASNLNAATLFQLRRLFDDYPQELEETFNNMDIPAHLHADMQAVQQRWMRAMQNPPQPRPHSSQDNSTGR